MPFIEARSGRTDDAVAMCERLIGEKAGTMLEKDFCFQQVMLYLYEMNDPKQAAEARDVFIQKFPKDQRAFELKSLDFLFNQPLNLQREPARKDEPPTPSHFMLCQNYPNPFNASTQFKYTISEDAFVSIKIYNMLSQEIVDLVAQHQSNGSYQVAWDGQDAAGSDVPGGVYLCSIRCERRENHQKFVQSRKLLLLR